jgi:hypothetical protein
VTKLQVNQDGIIMMAGSAGEQPPDLFLKLAAGGIWAAADQQMITAMHLCATLRAQHNSEWPMKHCMNFEGINANGCVDADHNTSSS